MDELLLAAKDKEELERSLRNKQFQIVGIYLGEERMFASRTEWKQSASKAADNLPVIIPISFSGEQCRKVGWHGVGDFIVPPSWHNFQYTEDGTYSDYFSAYILDAVTKIKKSYFDYPMIAVFQCPERGEWQNARNNYCDFLAHTFDGFSGIIPGIIPSFSQAYAGYFNSRQSRKNVLLTVNIDKRWTELFLMDKEENALMKTSASFGYDKNISLDIPLELRLNDYLHNSTANWTGKHISCWKEGFCDILRAIKDSGWPVADEADVICEGDIFPLVKESITGSRLVSNGGGVHLINNPSYSITDGAYKVIEKMFPIQKNSPKPRDSKIDDLFTL